MPMPFITPCKKFLRRLRRDNDGVTAVEFAFIAPVLIVMLMGTIEISMMMFAQNVMENATFQASRTGKTGFVAASQTQEQTIRAKLDEMGGSLLDPTRLSITSESYSSFGTVDQPEPFIDANANGVRDSGENYTDVNGNGQYDMDQGAANYGGTGDVVIYTVTYPWQIFTPIVGTFLGQDSFTLTSRTVIKNEPY